MMLQMSYFIITTIFTKAVNDAFNAAHALRNPTKKGEPVTYRIPDEGDLSKLLIVCNEFLKAFIDMQKFVAQHSEDVS